MIDPSKFFVEPQPAAALKLGLFAQYLSTYVSKTGRYAPGGRVVLWDAYAGKGRYDNGAPGSPQIALRATEALAKLSHGRDLRCFFTEANSQLFGHLDDMVRDSGLSAVALRGRAERHVNQVLAAAAGSPLFVLLDPFGLGLPYDDVVGKLLARTRRTTSGRRLGPPTEVMLNFSLPALFRNAGHLKDKHRTARQEASRRSSLLTVDRAMGGDWWREVWMEHADSKAACEVIVAEWRRRITRDTGYGTAGISVGDRWLGAPDYHLLLLTDHPHGLYEFNQSCSYAMEAFREACTHGQEQMELFDPVEGREERWVDEIEQNVRLLIGGPPCRVASAMPTVFGDVLGLARETHLRKALKRLERQGLLAVPVKGGLCEYVIAHPTQVPALRMAG